MNSDLIEIAGVLMTLSMGGLGSWMLPKIFPQIRMDVVLGVILFSAVLCAASGFVLAMEGTLKIAALAVIGGALSYIAFLWWKVR